MTRDLIQGYRFFRTQGKGANTALRLVRAESLADAEGMVWLWQDDHADWADYRKTDDRPFTTTEICEMYDADGNLLSALGAIWDATPDYRRVVEAGLASEYYSEEALRGRD